MAQQPMIGVLPLMDAGRNSYWMLPDYMKGIEEAGGLPVMLPLTADRDSIRRLAETFDGFLFTGGQDVQPSLYGEDKLEVCGEVSNERDEMERQLFADILELDKPAFGICRGLQLFNVLLGGTLYQDLPSQRRTETEIRHVQKPPYDQPVHKIYVEQGNPLHEIVRKETLDVNSYHHQGIKKLSTELLAVGLAEDGLVEAVVLPDRKFVLAVQWHPEFSYRSDDCSLELFRAFVQAC
ncbi:gamma-glutamyl-gamma-aminobutyrate hydrolase family protein [Paenibacillus sp. HN-1]|uniref:gamma-glutamyl-gamma-aminobutyrate hydrolase family protein n=1 Tax=Paenibacillus TaxID=44249 RepID=UPI001CA962F4|nr:MULTISPECIES: gamma-glutamyl-gamma-aminobutyrate hydrolase family protein [Paenibacillus]MBY9078639.1 gamma-glutamyl-gamma-aminobutyrate hydrolase family protein [Paenibacillus sp. CGMCC 1.18879]MBY9084175.1 gamma-glutamyl-gamma-aminobutyrate hydrolase family protein [Paenibacillus sinensis]